MEEVFPETDGSERGSIGDRRMTESMDSNIEEIDSHPDTGNIKFMHKNKWEMKLYSPLNVNS